VKITYLAFPAILGNCGHDWPQTKRVVALVACIANQHFVVISRLPGKRIAKCQNKLINKLLAKNCLLKMTTIYRDNNIVCYFYVCT